MNINKAIRKQKKTYKRFMLSMCFIFVLLPSILIVSEIINIFFIIYLVCIELLIIFAVFLRVNEEYIDFKCDGYKIIIWCGIKKAKFVVICKKVVLVHTREQGRNMEIIVITKSKFRNKNIQPIDIKFLKKYPYVAQMHNKIQNAEEDYFYFVINHGGFRKYLLVNALYKSCVQAAFSDDTIEKIKEYRDYGINPYLHK